MRTPNDERVGSFNSEDTAARGKPGPGEACPERRCILTGEHGERSALLRLAVSPDGDVLPDVLARAPGRGAWIGVSRSELEQAMAKGKLRGALARAFKGASLTVAEDLPERIQSALVRVLLDRLGLEMRAGFLILGSDRIAEQARGGVLDLLMHAADASEGGTAKLDQAWRVGRDMEGSGARGIRLPLDRAALSVALGRENVVHLGVAGRKPAERVEQALLRLLHYTGTPTGEPDDGGNDTAAAAKTN